MRVLAAITARAASVAIAGGRLGPDRPDRIVTTVEALESARLSAGDLVVVLDGPEPSTFSERVRWDRLRDGIDYYAERRGIHVYTLDP